MVKATKTPSKIIPLSPFKQEMLTGSQREVKYQNIIYGEEAQEEQSPSSGIRFSLLGVFKRGYVLLPYLFLPLKGGV